MRTPVPPNPHTHSHDHAHECGHDHHHDEHHHEHHHEHKTGHDEHKTGHDEHSTGHNEHSTGHEHHHGHDEGHEHHHEHHHGHHHTHGPDCHHHHEDAYDPETGEVLGMYPDDEDLSETDGCETSDAAETSGSHDATTCHFSSQAGARGGETSLHAEVRGGETEPQTSPPRTEGDADSSSSLSEDEKSELALDDLQERVIESLRQVYDPEVPVNIYDLGLIYKLQMDTTGRVDVQMTLTTPNCPVAESMPEQVQAAILAVEGVETVHVDLVWEPPWSPDMMEEDIRLAMGFF